MAISSRYSSINLAEPCPKNQAIFVDCYTIPKKGRACLKGDTARNTDVKRLNPAAAVSVV